MSKACEGAIGEVEDNLFKGAVQSAKDGDNNSRLAALQREAQKLSWDEWKAMTPKVRLCAFTRGHELDLRIPIEHGEK